MPLGRGDLYGEAIRSGAAHSLLGVGDYTRGVEEEGPAGIKAR